MNMDKMPTEQDIKNWYNKVYSSKQQQSMRPKEAYSVFLDYINAQKGKKLLDVSCGTGFLLLNAVERGLETYGVDISEEAVKVACRTSPESNITIGRGEDLKFEDKTFDYVTCLGSLEHFLDKNKGLQEMKRVAKDEARFCIMLPNSNFIYWKFSKRTGTEQQDINETLMTDKQWRNLFATNGLQVIDVFQDRWYARKVKVFESMNPLKVIKNLVLKLAWTILPLDWTYQFIYILKKAE